MARTATATLTVEHATQVRTFLATAATTDIAAVFGGIAVPSLEQVATMTPAVHTALGKALMVADIAGEHTARAEAIAILAQY